MWGVAEPLNETQSISPYDWVSPDGKVHHVPYRIGTGLVARGKHVLSLTPPATAARAYRSLQAGPDPVRNVVHLRFG
ncbi:hypothetical protein T484DRAFT_1785597 [Baffinella frigidus]|nr:hypothetical protein T484DRAFT_1785597 [Cryptophyta sp. CCMP2293]